MDDLNPTIKPDTQHEADGLLNTVIQSFNYLDIAESSPVCVGLSGGLDSVVLLHLLVKLQPQYRYQLSALYVHHGISPYADKWLAFCEQLCKSLSVPFSFVRLAPLNPASKGLENAAREARYAAFSQQPASVIALAHHQNDQAETVLLQLFRGTGLAGLAGMPIISQYAQKTIWRPLLATPRQQLFEWAEKHQLSWVEDDSNQDVQFRRNAIRHDILPLICQYWPNVTDQLAQNANICRESLSLLDDLAQLDAACCIDSLNRLNIAKQQNLSDARARNLLRFWIKYRLKKPIGHKKQLEEMHRQLKQFEPASTGNGYFLNIHFGWYRGYLYPINCLPNEAYHIVYQGEVCLTLPAMIGNLSIIPATGDGIKASIVNSGKITIANDYTQQQKMAVDSQRPRKSLKQIFQDHGIPFWLRKQWPMVFYEDRLIAIADLAIDPVFAAGTHEPGFVVTSQVPADVTATPSASPSSLSTPKKASTTTGSN